MVFWWFGKVCFVLWGREDDDEDDDEHKDEWAVRGKPKYWTTVLCQQAAAELQTDDDDLEIVQMESIWDNLTSAIFSR